MTRTIFLDRDGTLNREVGFVTSPAELDVLLTRQQERTTGMFT